MIMQSRSASGSRNDIGGGERPQPQCGLMPRLNALQNAQIIQVVPWSTCESHRITPPALHNIVSGTSG